MRFGDRLIVINPESEWLGCRGVMNGLYLNGTISVIFDKTGWEVSFEPFDLELEELSGDKLSWTTQTPLD